MEKMMIQDLADHCYRELSGGQQQRVLLARALCAAQKILLLDEPVSGLDPRVTADMYQLIRDLNKKDGITIIMISHDIAAAIKYATHILHIGENCFFGTRKQYLESSLGKAFTGQEEEEEGLVSVRSRFAGDEGQKNPEEFIKALREEIDSKTQREVKTQEA